MLEMLPEVSQIQKQVYSHQKKLLTATSKQIFCQSCYHSRCDGRQKMYNWLEIAPQKVAQDLTALDAVRQEFIIRQLIYYLQ